MHHLNTTKNWKQILTTLTPHILPERYARLQRQLSCRLADTALVLENLDDEMNAHACLRTAEAFGIQFVHLISSSDVLRETQKVHKGANKWLTVSHHKDVNTCISFLKRNNFLIAVSDVGSLSIDAIGAARSTVYNGNNSNGDIINKTRPRVAIVMGNEHRGCSKKIIDASDIRFYLPQTGFSQSLNVSVATGLSLHVFLNRTPDYHQLAIQAHKMRLSDKEIESMSSSMNHLENTTNPSFPCVEHLSKQMIDEIIAKVLIKSLPTANAILTRAGCVVPIITDDEINL
jgi:tRNA (guanosine-2'-O-)-methyltransferase